VDWGDWTESVFAGGERGAYGGERALFEVARLRGDRRELLIIDHDGNVVGAASKLDSDRRCLWNFLGVGHEQFVFSAFPDGFRSSNVAIVTVPHDFAGPPSVRRLGEAELGGPGRAVQRIATSSELTATEIFPGIALLLVTAESEVLVEPPFPGYTLYPRVRGARAFFTMWWSGERGIWSVQADGTLERYLSEVDHDVPYFDVGLEQVAE